MPVIIVAPTITVPFEELETSPTEEFTKDGFRATRVLVCNWADRLTLGRQFQGSISVAGTFITRVLPAAYNGINGVNVSSVGIEPFDDDRPTADGGDTSKAAYTRAKLTVQYSTGVLDSSGLGEGDANILVEESVSPTAEFMTLPPEGYKWDTGEPLKDEEAPGKLFRSFSWSYAMAFVPEVPDAVFDLVGKVNNATITSQRLGYTFPAETLLYNPPELHRVTTTEGVGMWALRYNFLSKRTGWNKFWHQKSGTWKRILTATGSPADPYELGDFLPLITI